MSFGRAMMRAAVAWAFLITDVTQMSPAPIRTGSPIEGGVALGLAVGVGFGLAVGVGFGLAVGVGFGFAIGVGFGLAVGVGFGFAIGVGFGLAIGVGLGFAVGVGLGVWPIIAVGLDPCVAAAPGLSVFAVGVPAAAEAIGRTLDVEEPQAARTIAAARASGSTMGQPSPRVLGVR